MGLHWQFGVVQNAVASVAAPQNVEIKDVKGSVFAEKLLFDIKKQKLNIASFNGGKVSANLSLK